MKTTHFTHQQAKELLHNKFVVILGGSNQRAMYKDLVLMLQKDNYLALSQLKTKGEEVFENDQLLEGGRRGKMTNGTEYKEVRQYTSDHHCVRFYFITRVYSEYMQTILEEFENGLKPDLVIANSCVWDVSRYGRLWEKDYQQNLTTFFKRMRTILSEETLLIWTMAMPLGKKIIGGFLVPEIAELGPLLRFDIVEANYYSATLANMYGFDVLDLHFQFRFSLQHRTKDGVHWNAVAHRRITCLLLAHIANAWGVELPPSQPPTGLNQSFSETNPAIKEIHVQPRKAQNQVTSRRPRERLVNYYPAPATPWMSPRYYAGLNQAFNNTNFDIQKIHQQPGNAQNQVSSWQPRGKWDNSHPAPATPRMFPRCYPAEPPVKCFNEPYPHRELGSTEPNIPAGRNFTALKVLINRYRQEQSGHNGYMHCGNEPYPHRQPDSLRDQCYSSTPLLLEQQNDYGETEPTEQDQYRQCSNKLYPHVHREPCSSTANFPSDRCLKVLKLLTNFQRQAQSGYNEYRHCDNEQHPHRELNSPGDQCNSSTEIVLKQLLYFCKKDPSGYESYRQCSNEQYIQLGSEQSHFPTDQGFSDSYDLPQVGQSHGDNYRYVTRRKYSRYAQYSPY